MMIALTFFCICLKHYALCIFFTDWNNFLILLHSTTFLMNFWRMKILVFMKISFAIFKLQIIFLAKWGIQDDTV